MRSSEMELGQSGSLNKTKRNVIVSVCVSPSERQRLARVKFLLTMSDIGLEHMTV